ncbi:MAG: hypothetical protein GTN93_21520 [Anaerolineae bacterium]|nr:hypothetical protein [Anaerolineae bacterium]
MQKAESADKAEIEKLHEELEKLKSQQSKMTEEKKRQEAILKALKDVPGLRAKNLRDQLDAEAFRKAYEEKFPIQQQEQFQRPK